MSSLCRGCQNSFTQSGYWSHFTQSRNPLCRAVLEEQLTAFYSDAETETSDSKTSDSKTSDSEREPRSQRSLAQDLDEDASIIPDPFAGDFFGSADDYTNRDFGQTDETESGTGESDCDEDDQQRQMDYELEESWEPRRYGDLPVEDIKMDSDSELDSEELGNYDTIDRCPVEQRIEECLTRSRIQVVRYSSQYANSRAGAVVNKRQSLDDQHSNALGSNTNPWAPFTSEIDWKIACWAKLRGPGSTAFSEFLAIDGVCGSYCFIVHNY